MQIDARLHDLIDQAIMAIGRLDGASTLFPDLSLFLYMYIRKEAVLSAQIEGTQSSLSDFLKFESRHAPGVPLEDVTEVSNYVAAMNHGLQRLREGFPLSLRLIKEIHQVLLRKGRGSEKEPGEFRRSQNWVGGARPGMAVFVPPPPQQVVECMGALELFLHNRPARTPPLVKAALAHVQFETIHPFLDGNGRLGRLLITLLLCVDGVLSEPLLYLSLYFKNHRREYYDLLQRVRAEGDWETWLSFFMEGIRETAENAANTARGLLALFRHDTERIQSLGKSAASAFRVHGALQRMPIASASDIAAKTGLSIPTAIASLTALERLGIAKELTGRKWGRLFAYDPYVRILNEGTEPIRPGAEVRG